MSLVPLSLPVLNGEIVQQNLEIMGEKFPDILTNDWNGTALPQIKSLMKLTGKENTTLLYSETHKSAGSTLQLGGDRLGETLREISHVFMSGEIERARPLIAELQRLVDEFQAEFGKR